MELFGWVGTVCFAISPLPQIWTCYRQGHAQGLNNGLLITWFIGEIAMLIYTYLLFDMILLVNYGFNLLCVIILMRYKYFPSH